MSDRFLLADAGFASGAQVAALGAKGVDALVAVSRTQPQRPYDFRPPPDRPKKQRSNTEPWRMAMRAKLESEDGKALYKLRKQSVEPVFGIVKSAMGFTHFLRGIAKVKTEWTLVSLAYNCRRLTRLLAPDAPRPCCRSLQIRQAARFRVFAAARCPE